MSDVRVSLTLTAEEAVGVQTILDQLINIDLFKEIPYDSYTALEKFIKATYLELETQKKSQRVGFEWGEACGKCGHSSKAHAQNGRGLCSQESCGPCFEFVPTGKPF